MGVRGLTTYIAENSKLYLKPYELHNCYLVVDGNNVACQLYKWLRKSDSIFGGDYDEFSKIVKEFFLRLKNCKVIPIVLIDGGYEIRKTKTILKRSREKLPILRGFARGYSSELLFPLFLMQSFVDVMEGLGICCIQCDLEADIEIAALARALNCPVLSYDSDFYIYNVLYIPFSSVYLEPVKCHDSNNYCIKCSLYDVKNFLKEFSGLDATMLPILATLLGNDYVDSDIFQKFFGHVSIPKSKYQSFTQRRIHAVLHWLKNENVNSATKLILHHLENKYENRVLQAIQTSIDDYNSTSVSASVINKLTSQLINVCLDKKDLKMSLPPEIVQLFSKGRIHKFVADIINLGTYFIPMQVENIFNQSSHAPFIPLIKDIYAILTPYLEDKQKPLKLYLLIKGNYTDMKINNDPSNYLNEIYLHDILKETKEERLKLLCRITGIEKDVLKIVSNNNWSIFIISYIYWITKLKNVITYTHVHALILMAISNKVVQKYVGYYSNNAKFMKSKRTLINQLKITPIETGSCTDFEGMLESVTPYEKLLVQGRLIPYRRTIEKGKGKAFNISTVHLFACFQSCLFHIMQINALLNYPLPHFKIGDFYSGTLIFNFFLMVNAKPEVEQFASDLFKGTPNLARIYTYLCESLCKYSEKPIPKEMIVKNKKKKHKKPVRVTLYDNFSAEPSKVDENENENYDDYYDKHNRYAMLGRF